MARRRLKVAAAAGSLILLTVLAHEFFLWSAWDFSAHYLQADRCLDGGGCWDEVDHVCRKNEPNAQQLCDRRFGR